MSELEAVNRVVYTAKDYEQYLEDHNLSVEGYLSLVLSLKDATDLELIDKIVINCGFVRQYADTGVIDFLQINCMGDSRYLDKLNELALADNGNTIFKVLEETLLLRQRLLRIHLSY